MGATHSGEGVARDLGKSAQLIARWSAKWNWVERVGEWGDEQDRQNRIAQTVPVAWTLPILCGREERDSHQRLFENSANDGFSQRPALSFDGFRERMYRERRATQRSIEPSTESRSGIRGEGVARDLGKSAQLIRRVEREVGTGSSVSAEWGDEQDRPNRFAQDRHRPLRLDSLSDSLTSGRRWILWATVEFESSNL